MNRYVDLPYAFCSRRLTIMRATWALALVAATLAPVASAAVTDITACPAGISSPGRYRLAVDCAVTTLGSAGIGINASNVHLNLGGHTISGPGCGTQGTTVGIIVNGSNVHVNGGTVEGFPIGIQVAANGNHLNGLIVTENCQGIVTAGVDDNRINGNNVSSNFNDAVFLVTGSNNNVIDENVINDNGVGVTVLDSDDNVIASNDISRNHPQGGVNGLLVIGSNNNTIRGNSTNDHPQGSGIIVNSGNNNTILENTANGNNIGIELGSGVSGNVIRRNMANNRLFDLRDGDVQPLSSICNDLWRNNTFVTDNEGDGPGAGCIQ